MLHAGDRFYRYFLLYQRRSYHATSMTAPDFETLAEWMLR